MKTQKYIAWVEGFCLESGEKIKEIRKSTPEEVTEYGFGEYTYEVTDKVSEALRFHKKDLDDVFYLLGVDTMTFHVTNRVPKGTMFNINKV